MNTASTQSPLAYDSRPGFFAQAEAWLDARGKPAWIIAMVLGFVFFWPIGLALLAYMIWSKRMFKNSCMTTKRYSPRKMSQTSVNAAFDAYKEETLRRLEEEQDRFEDFLKRLRDAKDKAEFDQFMDERATTAQQDEDTADDKEKF